MMQERRRIILFLCLILDVTLGRSSLLPRDDFVPWADEPRCNCVSSKFTSILTYNKHTAVDEENGRGLLFSDFREEKKIIFIDLRTRERHIIDTIEGRYLVVLKQQAHCEERNRGLFPFPLHLQCIQGGFGKLRYVGPGSRTKANHSTELWTRVTGSVNCTESYVIIEDHCFPQAVSCYNMVTAETVDMQYAAQHEGIRYPELFQYRESCSVDNNLDSTYQRQDTIAINRRNEESTDTQDEIEKAILSWQKSWYMLQ